MGDDFGRPEHFANLPGLGARPYLEAAHRPVRIEIIDEVLARTFVSSIENPRPGRDKQSADWVAPGQLREAPPISGGALAQAPGSDPRGAYFVYPTA